MAKTVKIYTKTGDRGTTSLFGGQRVGKDSLRIAAFGTVDELNSVLGVVLAQELPFDISKKLLRVQSELFVLGSDLASPYGLKVKIPRVSSAYAKRLEGEIDIWTKKLPQLRNFILPGGSLAGAQLHMARTIARRSERAIVSLGQEEKINGNAIVYLNRLSDWFFILARYVNMLDGKREVIWKGRG